MNENLTTLNAEERYENLRAANRELIERNAALEKAKYESAKTIGALTRALEIVAKKLEPFDRFSELPYGVTEILLERARFLSTGLRELLENANDKYFLEHSLRALEWESSPDTETIAESLAKLPPLVRDVRLDRVVYPIPA